MGIWQIGRRFGLALVLLAAVCVAATGKAEPGQKRRGHPGGPKTRAAKRARRGGHPLPAPQSASDLIADIQAPPAAAAAAASAGGASSAAARTYTVQAGDSLSKISKQFYGDANKYMKIFEANKDKLTDPNKVNVGTELRIP